MSFIHKKAKFQPRSRSSSEPTKAVSAYSYHNARSEFDENVGRDKKKQELEPQSSNYWLSRFGFILLLIAGVVCLYSVLDLSSSPRIVLLGSQSDDTLYQLYKPAFLVTSSSLFKQSIFNHNKITVNTNNITKVLLADFPEFSNISVTLPLIDHRPIIYVTPATPVMVLVNTDGQYLLNQSGIAMLYGYNGDNGFSYLKLPTIIDKSGISIQLGKPAITSQDVGFIQTVLAQLSARKEIISSMTLPQTSSELDIRLTGISYYVKFNLAENDPKLQAGSFIASQHFLESQNIVPGQYIDVRTDGRAYYQ